MAQDYRNMAGSMLSGGGMSDGKFWNFSRPDQEGFMPVLDGTLTKVSFSQARNYDANQRKFTTPAFWDDGRPKPMIRLHITDLNGEAWLHEIQPKSHCLNEDWLPKSPNGSIDGFLGQHIRVEAEQEVRTQDGRVIQFGSGNRRHFTVTVVGPGLAASEGVDYESLERLSKQRPQAAAAPQPQGYQPMPQGVQPQAYQPQPQAYQPQPQGYPQQGYQPMPPQQISRAMQQAYETAAANGYAAQQQTQQQAYSAAAPTPVAPPTMDVYDEDLPF